MERKCVRKLALMLLKSAYLQYYLRVACGNGLPHRSHRAVGFCFYPTTWSVRGALC